MSEVKEQYPPLPCIVSQRGFPHSWWVLLVPKTGNYPLRLLEFIGNSGVRCKIHNASFAPDCIELLSEDFEFCEAALNYIK